MIRVILLFGMLAVATGCQQQVKPTPAPTVVITGCQSFRIITVSTKDTPETKRQVLAHDQAYTMLCAGSKK